MNDPWTDAVDTLRAALPTWPEASVRDLVHHPRRCAPTLPDLVRITGLDPHLAHRLWTAGHSTRTAA